MKERDTALRIFCSIRFSRGMKMWWVVWRPHWTMIIITFPDHRHILTTDAAEINTACFHWYIYLYFCLCVSWVQLMASGFWSRLMQAECRAKWFSSFSHTLGIRSSSLFRMCKMSVCSFVALLSQVAMNGKRKKEKKNVKILKDRGRAEKFSA